MKIHEDFTEIGSIKNPILTIGTFDGVHIGHQKIIAKLNEEAQKCGGESVLFTFYPHPRLVLQPLINLQLIQTQKEKLEKLSRFGLNHTIIYPFTKEFSNTKAEDFIIEFLIKKLHFKKVVIGYDHQFGKNREGSIEEFKKLASIYDFEVIEIPVQEIDEINISSTNIRNAILEGNIEKANDYLNEAFELSGKVVHGKKLGNTIGFPTANIQIEDKNKIIPASGVYIVEVFLEGKSYNGMLNVGFRPTVTNDKVLSIEVHLLDFKQDLYGKNITIKLLKRLRNEQKFESIDALIQQLKKDEELTRTFFNL